MFTIKFLFTFYMCIKFQNQVFPVCEIPLLVYILSHD